MKHRCLNPTDISYKHYGGRGIKVCKRWMVFKNFVRDMGKRPLGLTLDRINNDGDYKPSNCRWATYSQQGNNCRRRPFMEISKKMRIAYRKSTKKNRINPKTRPH
jgi:hypothetical protein